MRAPGCRCGTMRSSAPAVQRDERAVLQRPAEARGGEAEGRGLRQAANLRRRRLARAARRRRRRTDRRSPARRRGSPRRARIAGKASCERRRPGQRLARDRRRRGARWRGRRPPASACASRARCGRGEAVEAVLADADQDSQRRSSARALARACMRLADPRRHHARPAPSRAASPAAGDLDAIAVARRPHRAPAPLPIPTRIGGFGGVEGLARYLVAAAHRRRGRRHPSLRRAISAQRRAACAAARVPLAVLTRPPWRRVPGDRWTEVGDAPRRRRGARADAAARVPHHRPPGARRLRRAPQHAYLVRAHRRAGRRCRLDRHSILARGPFALEDEMRADARAGASRFWSPRTAAARRPTPRSRRRARSACRRDGRAPAGCRRDRARRRSSGAGLDRGSSRGLRSCAASAARAAPGRASMSACRSRRRRCTSVLMSATPGSASARVVSDDRLVGAADGAGERDRRRAGLRCPRSSAKASPSCPGRACEAGL